MADGREVLDLVSRYDRASNRLERDAIARLHRTMDAAFRALERELRSAYPELQALGGLVAAQRKTLVVERLARFLDLLDPGNTQQYELLFEELLTTANGQGGTLADELLNLYESGAAERLERFGGIPIEAIANQASDGVKRLYRYSEDFRERASIVIGQGLIQGWGAARVARGLRSELGLAKGKAETLARTEMMASLNNGAIARYEQAGIEHVQWIVTPSEGLCPRCAARNMRVYQAKDVIYPLHPRDRCTLVPWKPEWQESGLTDDAFAAQYRKEGFDVLAKQGLKPDYSLSGFEKNAGLTKPPKPTWQPATLPSQTPRRATRRRTSQPATPPTTPPATPTEPRRQRRRSGNVLPKDHAVSQSPRINGAAINQGLDSISSNGAQERVAKFRQFVRRHDIQAVFPDRVNNPIDEAAANRDALKYKTPRIEVNSKAGANGYTSAWWNHVVVSVDSRGNADPFKVRGVQLDDLVDFAATNTPWSLSSLSVRGTDPQILTTYLHEMGHQIANKAGYTEYTKAGTPKAFKPRNAKRLTQYAHTNSHEWFAESFSAWMLDADRLRQFDPVTADFVEKTLTEATAREKKSRLP